MGFAARHRHGALRRHGWSGPDVLVHFANMFGMIVLCCFIAFVLSMLVERPYMSIGRDVIANFEPTTKNKALVGVGFAMVVGLSVGLMVAGAPDGPLAPPVPVKTF